MNELIIITGANKGLGYELSKLLFNSSKSRTIISFSRNIAEDQKAWGSGINGNHFIFIANDFKIDTDGKSIKEIDPFLNKFDKIIFISNAATVQPLGLIGKLDGNAVHAAIDVNCIFPAYFINHLMSKEAGKEVSIIHISSGAANKAILGWAMYSSCKAMMEMFIKSLEVESKDKPNIKVSSIDPGVINTNMQQEIRNVTEDGVATTTEFFKKLHDDKMLQDPAEAALEILKKYELV